MSVDTRYAYAIGRIRAVERKLLDKSSFERMVDANSVEDVVRIIAEAGYGGREDILSGAFGYEELLKEEYGKVYSFLKEIGPEPEVFDIFRLRNDYHNVKVILKAAFAGQSDENMLVGTGAIPLNKLKTAIKDRKFSDIPHVMAKAIEESIDTFNRTGDPQTIDILLDRANFEHMREMADNYGNAFLKELVRIMIDLTNIRIFLRIRNLRKSADFLRRSLLPGGSMDERLFARNLEEPLEEFINILSYKPYWTIIEGIESFRSTGSFTKLEKLVDNYIISFVRKALYMPFGVEPLIGYLFAKDIEIKNIRIVMVGKINRMPNEIIRERLRDTYV